METHTETYGLRQRAGLLGGLLLFVGLLLAPAPEGLPPEAWRVVPAASLMAVWWMTEAISIFATSLLPLALLPLLGVASVGEAAAPYANPLIFLFMGGFMIALAMERWQLHRRIALRIVRRIGTAPTRIVAGFMVAAAFLSMWVSNTATALMMLPIGLSVVELTREAEARHFPLVLMLAIAYACSIGGVGTLIGTPTNALLAGFMVESYGVEIGFLDWMLLALPLVVVGLVLTFFVLTRLVYPIRLKTIPGGRAFIEAELRRLGPMARPEKTVAVVFALVAALWIFRPLLDDLLPGLTDPGIAMLAALVLFVLPSGEGRGAFVLNWAWAQRLPWGVLLLFGGGLSLAAAINDTGLAAWIGAAMGGLAAWPLVLIVLLVTTVIIALTELTSNTATAAAFLPVLASIAVGMGQDPLVLLVPAAIAASCAFMLPVATPPNAIVYGSNAVTIPQMARAGLWLNLLFVLLITAFLFLLLPLVFGITL